jgi:hypothetical protein
VLDGGTVAVAVGVDIALAVTVADGVAVRWTGGPLPAQPAVMQAAHAAIAKSLVGPAMVASPRAAAPVRINRDNRVSTHFSKGWPVTAETE